MSINTSEAPALYSGKSKYALFILPALYGFLLFLFYYQVKFFFTTGPDPVYAYLINGTNLASGNFDVGHFDHPGTPVQWLAALIVFIAHLFFDKGQINESVISNPEFYLGACTTILTSLLMLSVFAGGRLILKHTGNITIALLFQLVPITWYASVFYIVKIIPESLLIICLSYYTAFLFVLCYKRNYFPESPFSNKSFLLFFSFISALLLTTKITCLPLLIIPLFFIKGMPKKFLYATLTIVFALLIIYPVWSKFPKMLEWFNNLATHSGTYGQGKKEMIDKTVYFSNLVRLLTDELFFGIGYVLILIAAITGWVKKKRSNDFYKLTLAIWMVCSFQLILVAKHFGHHYMLASKLMILPGVIAAYLALINAKPNKLWGYCILLVCSVWLVFKTAQNAMSFKGGNKIYESYLSAKKYDNIPKIITTGFQGACFPESALNFASYYGGDYFYTSNYFIRKRYPNSYFYLMHLPANVIKKLEINLSPFQFFRDKPKVLVYFIQMDKRDEQEVLNKMTAGLDSIVKNIRLEEFNENTQESFYIIEIDTLKAKSFYANKIELNYNFESTNSEKTLFTPASGDIYIGEAAIASEEKHYSGMHSIKILPGQYACCYTFEVSPGDEFDISVKHNSSDKPVGITLSSNPAGAYENNFESITEIHENGWKTSRMQALIPANFQGNKLNFCLYYFGSQLCYADDLNIVISKSGKHNKMVSPTPEDLHKFIIKADDGNYITLTQDFHLVANQPDSSKAEVFEKVDLGNGLIAIKASNGKFVCDERNENSGLIANREVAQNWETFRIIGNLKSLNIQSSTGMFVCADHGSNNMVIANKPKASSWETFELIKKQ